MLGFFLRRKVLTAILLIPIVLVLIGYIWLLGRMRGPFHDYELDLVLPAPEAEFTANRLEVGVAKRNIAPPMSLYDPWVDVNENSKFDPDIDTYEDRNGNGKFDGIWLAGFGTNRPAKGINDPPWVRAIAMRNNGVTIAMVTIDAVGIFHNEFVAVRKALDPALGIDHVLFSSTHSHEVPDTMKIWSFGFRINVSGRDLDVPIFGFDEGYMRSVQDAMKEAVEEAVRELEPADMYVTDVEIEPEGFVNDSRKPVVMDDTMYLWRFTKPDSDETIATFVNWGNHPETLGARNSLITSDFPHWLREGIEAGVPDPNGAAGLGGMCLYFQGQVGGLMTQLHTTVPHRDGERLFKEDSFEKAESLGYNLALVALQAFRSDRVWENENPELRVIAQTIKAPMEGPFRYAIMLGLIHEGYYAGGRAKTEINVLRIGDVLVLSTPGEIYPELVEGGVEAKPGNDFNLTAPFEGPPLRNYMEARARQALIIGLGNDEIGYIVPKSQWDVEAPFVYNGRDQYGEENSPGPETAPIIYGKSRELVERMNAFYPEADPAEAR